MQKYIVVKTSFEGVHLWPYCPIKEVEYLKYPHRHVFNVLVKVRISENDREIEFIQFKHRLQELIEKFFPKDEKFKISNLKGASCEMIADKLFSVLPDQYDVACIAVDEDGENGIEFVFEKEKNHEGYGNINNR